MLKKFYNYQVSSEGFVLNNLGKKIGYLDKTTNIFKVKIVIEGKKKIFNLHSLIVLLFVPGIDIKNVKISHIDKNPCNCSLDNLKIINLIDFNTEKISDEIMEKFYNFNIYKYCYSYVFKHSFIIDHVLFTVDDIVQDMVFFIYKRLYLYNKFSNLPFVAFIEMLAKQYRLKQFEKATAEKNKKNISLDYLTEKFNNYDFIENNNLLKNESDFINEKIIDALF